VTRRRIEISRPDKVLFPDPGVTKAELAEYYERVAPAMLPHLRERPLNLWLFPDGIEKRGILRQQMPDHFPEWIRRVTTPKKGGSVTHAVCNDADTLVYLAGQACVTPHNWLSRVDKLDRPDRIVFDLDPTQHDFGSVRRAARELGDLLRELGLKPHAMTTGSRGVHVVTPIRRDKEFDHVRAFARDVARVMAARDPGGLTVEQRKNKRGDRIFIDVGRNAYAQTAVPPYAVRPKPGAPVSTPLDWSELSDGRLTAQRYNVRNLFRRLDRDGDPWRGMSKDARPLASAVKKLGELDQPPATSRRRNTR
jgi:bifunctional non-homologous end joining protein LigD